eukprot:2345867-Pyramimonas_sp.AAC.1
MPTHVPAHAFGVAWGPEKSLPCFVAFAEFPGACQGFPQLPVAMRGPGAVHDERSCALDPPVADGNGFSPAGHVYVIHLVSPTGRAELVGAP